MAKMNIVRGQVCQKGNCGVLGRWEGPHVEVKGQDVAPSKSLKSIFQVSAAIQLSKFAKSQKLFRLEDNIVLRHMLYAELPDSYIVFEMKNFIRAQLFWGGKRCFVVVVVVCFFLIGKIQPFWMLDHLPYKIPSG